MEGGSNHSHNIRVVLAWNYEVGHQTVIDQLKRSCFFFTTISTNLMLHSFKIIHKDNVGCNVKSFHNTEAA